MKKIITLVFTVAALVFAGSNSPVATIHKPVGTVEYKSGGKDWRKAVPAIPLFSGDLIRTKENSFVIVKFIENSLLRVQEKSEITIRGDFAQNKEFSKNVYLQRGELGFKVQKRPNEKFEFSTPTSVASIRGTEGLLISNPDSASDILILGSGTVEFKNNISNVTVTVGAGQTAKSYTNGTINVKTSTREQINQFYNSVSGGGGTDTTGTGGGGQQGGSSGSSTTSGGFSLSFNVTAPLVKEKNDLEITVEITQTSISLDTLKNLIAMFSVYYRTKNDQPYKQIIGTFGSSKTKFKIPSADVIAPSVEAYVSIRVKNGTLLTYPQSNPESNPILIPIQAGEKNQLKIEFTDPSGKRKTMVIEY